MEPLHIQLEYNESIAAKKNILNSEISLINALKRMQNFKDLRKKEIAKKIELKSKINDILSSINFIKKNLPKTKIPEIEMEIEEDIEGDLKSNSLESELRLIQKKLANLNTS